MYHEEYDKKKYLFERKRKYVIILIYDNRFWVPKYYMCNVHKKALLIDCWLGNSQ